MNAIVEAAEPKAASLQIPEETVSLIKASIAENTLKAYQRALNDLTNMVIWSNAIRCPLSELHHRLTRSRQITGNHRTSRRRREMATEASITGNRELPCHAGNVSRHPQSG